MASRNTTVRSVRTAAGKTGRRAARTRDDAQQVTRTTRAAVRRTGGRLARTWDDARQVLGLAESTLERRLRTLARRTGLDATQAGETMAAWRRRVELQRRKTLKQVEARLMQVQARARKERRMVGRMVDDAVRGALAALNIPSRQEVHELTRRVEELSRKIDGFRRPATRRPKPHTVTAATVPATAS